MRLPYSKKDYLVFDPIRKGRPSGPITRNLQEFAAEIGLTHNQLAHIAAREKAFPEPVIKHVGSRSQNSRTYYRYAELKRWWKTREVKE